MTTVTLLLLNFLLPHCSGYSITSSLGPTYEYNPYGASTGSASRLLSAIGATTASPAQFAEPPMSESYSNEDEAGRGGSSHLIYARDNSNRPSYRGPYNPPSHEQNQYTPTQLQIAGRIMFEARATTAKPYLGYRSFISSYRNPNYFVKQSKTGDNRFYGSSKNPYANINDEDQPLEAYYNKNITASSKQSSIIIPLTVPQQYTSIDVTTPESKTAPATLGPIDLATDRPSSTQQMLGDSAYGSSVFAGSESNNHYQFTGNKQWIRGYADESRPVQISSPKVPPSPSSPKSTGRHLPGANEDGQDFEYDTTVSSHIPDNSRVGVEEEPIVFPTTTNPSPKPYYKLPGIPDLGNLKNIIELRNGENATQASNSKKHNYTIALHLSEKLSPVADGSLEPPCAKNLGYCDMDNFQDSYPKEAINSVLANSISSDLFQKVFGDVDETEVSNAKTQSADIMLVGRHSINTLSQETALCASQEITIYPRAAKNKDDKWMFIVNHDDYVQGVRVEKCRSEGSACLFGDVQPFGYESVCRQKFILRKLVALNDDGKTSVDTFKLPSCCVCFLKSNYISDRTGAIPSSPRNPAQSDNKNGSSSSQRVGNQDAGGDANDSPTECSDQKEKKPEIEAPSNRNSTSLLPDLSHVNSNTTNPNLAVT